MALKFLFLFLFYIIIFLRATFEFGTEEVEKLGWASALEVVRKLVFHKPVCPCLSAILGEDGAAYG